MSAGLEQFDWMMSAKEKPWHGIGTVVSEAPTSDEAIKIAKLDWEVEKSPLMTESGIVMKGFFANVRKDISYPLGIVKKNYVINQNQDAFKFVDNLIEQYEGECHYETAGSLFNGRKVFLLVKLPNKNILGDETENYLYLLNSHDGSSAIRAGITNVRIVCNNTLQMALKNTSRSWSCRHTTKLEERKLEATSSLKLSLEYLNNVEETAKELDSIKIDETKFINSLIAPYKENPKVQDDIKEKVLKIYHDKDDLQNMNFGGWRLYNAVSDYVSNALPVKDTKTFAEKKMEKFMVGYKLLDSAQKILMAA
jgi:phage/plasmid-like protein (TIGR03299 family)